MTVKLFVIRVFVLHGVARSSARAFGQGRSLHVFVLCHASLAALRSGLMDVFGTLRQHYLLEYRVRDLMNGQTRTSMVVREV